MFVPGKYVFIHVLYFLNRAQGLYLDIDQDNKFCQPKRKHCSVKLWITALNLQISSNFHNFVHENIVDWWRSVWPCMFKTFIPSCCQSQISAKQRFVLCILNNVFRNGPIQNCCKGNTTLKIIKCMPYILIKAVPK